MTEIQYYRDFEASDYGQELVQRTRFDKFKPDFVNTELWGDLLGDDVNNLYHMSHTHEIAKTFALYEGLGELATHRLLHTAITHDFGEAIIGDIPLPEKTGDDEKREEIAYRRIANELFGGVQGKLLSDSVWKILSHEDEELGDQFRAIEYVGYCTTAERAGTIAVRIMQDVEKTGLSIKQDGILTRNLLEMKHAVVTHNFPVLAGYVKKYPSMAEQLREYRG